MNKIRHETWSPDSAKFEHSIEQAILEINSRNSQEIIWELKQKVQTSKNGIKFAVLDGGSLDRYSSTDAMVIFNPFANTATPNMLVRAEFIRLVAKHEDIRDEEGRLKPVVMLASPGIGGSKIKLSESERDMVKRGELGPIAKEMLHAVSEAEIGRVALFGFSQGADMAIAGAREGYDANLDTQSIAVGDPAGIADRNPIELGIDFGKSGTLKGVVEPNGIAAQKQALGVGYGTKGFVFDFLPNALGFQTNRLIWRALGNNSFERRIQEVIDEGRIEEIVLGYGGKSAITKPERMDEILGSIKVNDLTQVSAIKIDSAKHTWGDDLPLHAKLCMQAVR